MRRKDASDGTSDAIEIDRGREVGIEVGKGMRGSEIGTIVGGIDRATEIAMRGAENTSAVVTVTGTIEVLAVAIGKISVETAAATTETKTKTWREAEKGVKIGIVVAIEDLTNAMIVGKVETMTSAKVGGVVLNTRTVNVSMSATGVVLGVTMMSGKVLINAKVSGEVLGVTTTTVDMIERMSEGVPSAKMMERMSEEVPNAETIEPMSAEVLSAIRDTRTARASDEVLGVMAVIVVETNPMMTPASAIMSGAALASSDFFHKMKLLPS